jgi:SNF2 family DNA or RNA helicase
MVGTDAMASGLNFQGADVIFNFDDPWSPSTISQREGRSLRIGQKNSVTVVNFVVKDTIEERILQKLAQKPRAPA